MVHTFGQPQGARTLHLLSEERAMSRPVFAKLPGIKGKVVPRRVRQALVSNDKPMHYTKPQGYRTESAKIAEVMQTELARLQRRYSCESK